MSWGGVNRGLTCKQRQTLHAISRWRDFRTPFIAPRAKFSWLASLGSNEVLSQ